MPLPRPSARTCCDMVCPDRVEIARLHCLISMTRNCAVGKFLSATPQEESEVWLQV